MWSELRYDPVYVLEDFMDMFPGIAWTIIVITILIAVGLLLTVVILIRRTVIAMRSKEEA
jgi:hypothetical protein